MITVKTSSSLVFAEHKINKILKEVVRKTFTRKNHHSPEQNKSI